uniref:Uncharacterized protein n=1 Tax=Chromera velia CCMP2878 TaxID=1169474 RepID=A0A0G4FBD4_9ALVE|eukprot:Cvel_3068.t1-p1 / transcript=Cvel_3068.t1 / gene=Cvel_3068 / organism=Chromera_velia_CCMP2878 / gene_product=Ankyrin repeat domain-containing protein 29, putative / transcript_product=Ankyrin repeat domain-containing protein 29, putative / location=Cvel_scaffold122:113439-115466(-) / protein_length=676 / sequence_SO=supercontig / SO=protein_coding / is_pseudo=false
MLAAEKGHCVVVEFLLQKKAKLGLTKGGTTALIMAAQHGHPEVVALLLREKVDVNQKRKDGSTSLMLAAQNGHTDVVCLLVRHRADVHRKNNGGFTALMMASSKGHADVMAVLLREKAGVNVKTWGGYNSLMLAAHDGHPEVISLLVREKAQMDEKNIMGCTALMYAAQNGYLDVVIMLLQHGADPAITAPDGSTAVKMAASMRHLKIRDLLAGMTPSLLDEPSVDWMAAQTESWKLIQELIVQGAIALWPLPVLRLLLQKGRPVPRRQDVLGVLKELGMEEAAAQNTLQAAAESAKTGFPQIGGFTVVCLSFSWLSQTHPDPEMFHLRLLVEALNLQWWAEGENAERVFVFWDFMSLYQWPRDGEQYSSFQQALQQMDLLYSSPHTRVFRSTGVPPKSPNPLPYGERGWPTLETCVTCFKPSRLICELPTRLPTPQNECETNDESHSAALSLSQQPVQVAFSPEQFNSFLKKKKFKEGADAATVKSLYKQFISRSARSMLRVSFAGRAQFSDEDAASLCGLFRHFLSIQKGEQKAIGNVEGEGRGGAVQHVDLSGTGLTDKGAVMLMEALGGMKGLKTLIFAETQVTSDTVKALSKSMQEGGMLSLVRVSFVVCMRIITNDLVDVILKIGGKVEERGVPLDFELHKAALDGLSGSGRKQLRQGVAELNCFSLVLA